MTADTYDSRRLLPRWRPWQAALLGKEMSPQRPLAAPHKFEPALQRALEQWRFRPTSSRSSEVLAAALHHGAEADLVAEIAARVRDGHANSQLRNVAQQVFDLRTGGAAGEVAVARVAPETTDQPGLDYVSPAPAGSWDGANQKALVRDLRRKAHEWPRNPFTWMDLARAYFTLGLEGKARRSVEVALGLAPDNRFIVRSATRYLVHVGEEGLARAVIGRASGARDDPWMFAAAAAVNLSRKNSVRDGLRLLESGQFAPWHLSELGATLASREDESGQSRMARQLMRKALVDPTENVLAHAEWAPHLVAREVPDTTRQISPPFEALARRTARRLEWNAAADHAWQWHLDEPFSTQASGTGSCYALYAHRYDQAIAMTTNGLRANPGDPTLLNNRAFAYVCAWKLAEAVDDLRSIDRTAADINTVACATATAGLLAFRIGRPDLGRDLYGRAIRDFSRRKQPDLAARASINLASEERRIGSAAAHEAEFRAENLVSRARSAEVTEAWQQLRVEGYLGGVRPESSRANVPPALVSYTLELEQKFRDD